MPKVEGIASVNIDRYCMYNDHHIQCTMNYDAFKQYFNT